MSVAVHNRLWNRLLAALKLRNALPADAGNCTPLEIARFADERLRTNLAVPFVEGYYLERRYGGSTSKWSEAEAEALILHIEFIAPLFSSQAAAVDAAIASGNPSLLGTAGTIPLPESFKPLLSEPVLDESQAWGSEYVDKSLSSSSTTEKLEEEERQRQEENARRAEADERNRRIEEERKQRQRNKEEQQRQREEAERKEAECKEAEERDRRAEESRRLTEEEARRRAGAEARRVAAEERRARDAEAAAAERRKREAAEEQARRVREKELSRARHKRRDAWMDNICVVQKYLWRSWAIFLLVWLIWTGAFSGSLTNWAHRGVGAWLFDLMTLGGLQTEYLIGDVESMGSLIKKFVLTGAFGVGIVLISSLLSLVVLAGGFENHPDILTPQMLASAAISLAVPLTLFILSYVNALLMYADLKD